MLLVLSSKGFAGNESNKSNKMTPKAPLKLRSELKADLVAIDAVLLKILKDISMLNIKLRRLSQALEAADPRRPLLPLTHLHG